MNRRGLRPFKGSLRTWQLRKSQANDAILLAEIAEQNGYEAILQGIGTMRRREEPTVVCQICGKPKKRSEVLPAELVRSSIAETIRKTHPGWSPSSFICLADLNDMRNRHIEQMLADERGEFSELEGEVARSLKDQELLSQNVNTEFESTFTYGERMADAVARFGGSWRFILIFAGVLLVWISVNGMALLWRPFDPYPFILLNLVLSCLAAVQAPIIMMSQNRQEAKDRMRAEHDYQVNLKAEWEIRQLNQKMDMLLRHQWQRLMDIQQIQMDTIEELAGLRKEEGGQGPRPLR